MKRMFLAFFIVLASIGVYAFNVKSSGNTEQQKTRLTQRIEGSSSVQVFADNAQGSQLYIQDANVKEISGDEFKILVGEPSAYLKQTTYPEVTLMNGYTKTIKSFAIIVQSATDKPKSGHILMKKNLSILPNGTYKVLSGDWVKVEDISLEQEGKFINRTKQPGLQSAKFWLPGAASDLRVTVGLVEFEDGTKWMISQASDW